MFECQNQIELSIIIPVFNEEMSILILYTKIEEVLCKLKYRSEIIFIDDGSTDSSGEILKYLCKLDENVRLFGFNSNRGQHKAIEKGFLEARGEIIVTLDGDLQNNPYDIPKLIAKLDEGFDIVCGWRSHRKDPWQKKLKSIIGNYLQRKITKIDLHDMSCSMRAYKKAIIKNLSFRHKYEVGLLPYIISKYTNKITEVKINHHARSYGKSKYDFFQTSLGTILYYLKLIINRSLYNS